MSEVSTYSNLQILAYDPTRTTYLRTAFVRDMNRRFNSLMKIIREAVVTQDCFGLTVQTNVELTSPFYQQFNFPSTGQKVESFMEWLKQQEDRSILEETAFLGIGAAVPWTNTYVSGAYQIGIQRARTEMIRQNPDIPSVEASGGLPLVFLLPHHADYSGLAFTQAFEGLKEIATTMDSQIRRVLAQGLVDGLTSRQLARKLLATIKDGSLATTDTLGRFIPAKRRAEMLARTEIIRAHHLANIQEYKTWQVRGVVVTAEWSTAGDDRVCDQCAGMHGNRYTLKEIEHMIPVHPNCRCIALPIVEKKK